MKPTILIFKAHHSWNLPMRSTFILEYPQILPFLSTFISNMIFEHMIFFLEFLSNGGVDELHSQRKSFPFVQSSKYYFSMNLNSKYLLDKWTMRLIISWWIKIVRLHSKNCEVHEFKRKWTRDYKLVNISWWYYHKSQ